MDETRQDTKLSKLMSLMLRHEPERFGLELDDEGYTPLGALVAAIRRIPPWAAVTGETVAGVVARSDKQRFEIAGDRIRARYGHSTEGRVAHPPVVPPDLLYHGTSRHALASIGVHGLRAMARQYVHLSEVPELAFSVGRRHDREPVVLVVEALKAHESGVVFHSPQPRLYLAAAVPPEFVRVP